MTDELFEQILMWKRIKKYGWPEGKGYLSAPRTVFEAVELFDNESDTKTMFDRKNQEK